MKKQLLRSKFFKLNVLNCDFLAVLCICILFSLYPQIMKAADNDIITGWSEEGYKIKMQVISEESKTTRLYGYYKVNYGPIPCIDESISGVITIPSQSEGYSIVEVGQFAFNGCTKLTEIKLPEGILSIGNDALEFCYELENFKMPSTVINFETSFNKSKKLKHIEVAEGNQIYDSRNNCNAIIKKDGNILVAGCANTIIPDGIKEIGKEAFMGQSSVTKVELPNSVKIINENAFSSTSLTTINLSGVEKIQRAAFGATLLSSVDLTGLKTIENSVFENCSYLTDVTFDNELDSIKSYAFGKCPIEKIVFPSTLTYIGYEAFKSCKSLTTVSFPKSLTYIGYGAFTQCEALKEVSLPRSLMYLGDEAFYYCSGLKEIIIPSALDTIRNRTFAYCTNAERITLGKNISFIGDEAFGGCDKLTEITSCIQEPFVVDKFAFLSRMGGHINTYEDVFLLVPKGTRDLYASTSAWNEFLRIKEFDPTAQISVSTSADGLGAMSIAGIFDIGSEITLSTSAEKGWNFVGWFVNDENISTDTELTITVNEDAEIVAKFKNEASAINETKSDKRVSNAYYTLDGQSISTPKVGINIIRTSDGKTKKVMIK